MKGRAGRKTEGRNNSLLFFELTIDAEGKEIEEGRERDFGSIALFEFE